MAVDDEGRQVSDEAPPDAPRALPRRRPTVRRVQSPPAVASVPQGAASGAPQALPRSTGTAVDAPAERALLRATSGAVPLVEPVDVRVAGALPPLPPVVDAALTAHLAGLTASLELRLGRALATRVVTDVCVPDEVGRIYLSTSPVRRTESVSVNGAAPVAWTESAPPTAYQWGAAVVEVTYEAGSVAESPWSAAAAGALVRKALPYARALLAQEGARAAGGAASGGTGRQVPTPPPGVKAFAVEGLDVTFESPDEAVATAAATALAVAQQSAWSADEVAGIGIPRRVVAL